jgi:hypothetical protein
MTSSSHNSNPSNTLEVIQTIVAANPLIDALFIHRFLAPPPFDKRLHELPQAKPLFDEALRIRQLWGVPFPDALNVALLHTQAYSPEIVRAVAYHHDMGLPHRVSRDEVVTLSGQGDASPSNQLIALSSRVGMVGRPDLHLQLLDFHIQPSAEASRLALAVLVAIKAQRGWLLDSGRSYHFISEALVDSVALQSFLARAMLFAPITDRNWIAHQLIEGRAALRIFGNPRTGAGQPVVVARVTSK